MNDKKIVMLASSGRGGILSLIESFQRDGLFQRWKIHFVATHEEGTLFVRLKRAVISFFQVFFLMVTKRIALLHIHVAKDGSIWRKLIFAMMAHCFGIPVILHLHAGSTKDFYNALPLLGQRLLSQQFKSAVAVVVLSESWRVFVLEVAPKARILVLPNYVDMPEDHRQPNKSDKIRVLFLGLLGENKGIYDLLAALAQVIQKVPQLELNVGGNGEIDKAKAVASQLELNEHVNFLDWVSGEAKNELLRTADIFVLPSYYEGLPISVLEAMSWGIPVITTPVGGIPDVIQDRVNGFLVTPGDTVALQRLLELLAQDQQMRDQIGLAGQRSIKNEYSKDAVLPKLERLYADIISKSF